MSVWLDRRARTQIETEARRHRLRETGGPLFGFEHSDSGELVIVAAGGPGPRATHRRHSFVPDRAAVDRAISRVHTASEGRYNFIGSWHTHPKGRPVPSATDIATAQTIASDTATDLPAPLLIIQATRPLRRTLRDRDLQAYRWNPLQSQLERAPLTVVGEQTYPQLDIDWATVVG